MKKRQKKSIREVQGKDQFSGEQSPYWSHLQSHQRIDEEGRLEEDEIANPDSLSEDDHLFHKPLNEEGEFKFKTIREIIPTLSPQQQRLLNLCGMEGKSIKDAAKTLGISTSTANTFLRRARETIIRIYNSKKAKALAEGEI